MDLGCASWLCVLASRTWSALRPVLQHPLLLVELAAVAALVAGAGRALGLPYLFWNERRSVTFTAGAATTFAVAEIGFVGYLLQREPPCSPGRWMLVLAGLWLLFVLAFTLAGRAGAPDVSLRPRDRGARSEGGEATGGHRAARWPMLAGALFTMTVLGALGAMTESVAASGAWPGWLAGFERRASSTSSAALHALQLIASLAALVLWRGTRAWAPPALALALFLALVAALHGALAYWSKSAGLPLVALVGLLCLGGIPRYKVRLAALAAHYARPVDYRAALRPETSSPASEAPFVDQLVRPGQPRWPEHGGVPEPGLPVKRPIVLLCTSGGGIRAAAWTVAVLGHLDRLPGFRPALRMVTGASGGMVGTAFWLARLHARPGGTVSVTPAEGPARLATYRAVTSDSLSPLARTLFYRDLPRALWPRHHADDRGAALEAAWAAALAREARASPGAPVEAGAASAGAGPSFADLRAAELSGALPTVVFSPMLVEDGRRLLVGNARLSEVVRNHVGWLPRDPSQRPASTSAVHLSRLFPEEAPRLPILTAARLSAAFPYVSAAATLPTSPRRRVVDAGYFDNYGVELACTWLREALEVQGEWIARNVSGVLVIQIRDEVSALSLEPEEPSRGGEVEEAHPGVLARGLEGLTTPPSALLRARESAMAFRNDAAIETVQRLYGYRLGSDFVQVVTFQMRGAVSLSWTLTGSERSWILRQARRAGVLGKYAHVGRWLRERNAFVAARP